MTKTLHNARVGGQAGNPIPDEAGDVDENLILERR